MSAPRQSTVQVNGKPCRVWEKGRSAPLGFIAGFAGLPRWTPFLDLLAQRRQVIAPSLPGFPGGLGHAELDTQLDWVLAARDLLHLSGLDGADIVAAGFGAALAADVAALWPESVRTLTLIAPFGVYFDDAPIADVWAPPFGPVEQAVVVNAERFKALVKLPEGGDPVEWPIELARASEAAARFLWPLGNTGLLKRLHRIKAPTLLLWGEQDRIVPPAYAQRYRERIQGKTEICMIPAAGHLAELDQPGQVAAGILNFLERAA